MPLTVSLIVLPGAFSTWPVTGTTGCVTRPLRGEVILMEGAVGNRRSEISFDTASPCEA
jgi:hypothetical protein